MASFTTFQSFVPSFIHCHFYGPFRLSPYFCFGLAFYLTFSAFGEWSPFIRSHYGSSSIAYIPDQTSSSSGVSTTQKESFSFPDRRISPKGIVLKVRWFRCTQCPPEIKPLTLICLIVLLLLSPVYPKAVQSLALRLKFVLQLILPMRVRLRENNPPNMIALVHGNG